ncbi:MAG: DNA polymerase Y family protein, partial [Novosphingobium sp.]|nr:DNA polymerase Y family protein [Novosphingobium sp.]
MPGPLPLTGRYESPPLNRRVLAVWCAALAIDRWRLVREDEADDTEPTVLIMETAHGPRIAAANRAGLEAGARPGMMLADARTLCPQLATAPADPAGDLAFLENLALWAQRWGPWSALDPPDGVIVDVTGVAHLFGGESTLLADVRAALARRELTARCAIAPTAGAAWALAHFGPDGAILPPGNDMADRLTDLPVAALRLDDDTLLVLRRLGLKRLGDLHWVAREALARRFRNIRAPAANPLIRMDQLLGRVPEPLLPVIDVAAPLVQRRLMEPIRHRSLLDRVVIDLAEDMGRVLEGLGQGARRLELGMWKVDGEVVVRRLELAAPSRDPAHVAGLFGRKLDDVDAGFG